jgi:hypothetical protein
LVKTVLLLVSGISGIFVAGQKPLQTAPGIKHQVWLSSPVEALLSRTEARKAARSAEFSKDHNRRNKRLSR